MNYDFITDHIVKEHVKQIARDQMSLSTWTGEILLGGKMGAKIPPLLSINMYVRALFVIIHLLRIIEERK